MKPFVPNLALRLLQLIVAMVLIWLFIDASQGYKAPEGYDTSYGQFGLGLSITSATLAIAFIWQDKAAAPKVKWFLFGVEWVLVLLWLITAMLWMTKYHQGSSSWDRKNVTWIFQLIIMSLWAFAAILGDLQDVFEQRKMKAAMISARIRDQEGG